MTNLNLSLSNNLYSDAQANTKEGNLSLEEVMDLEQKKLANSSPNSYTTSDEISFLRGLFIRCNYKGLVGMRNCYQYRSWEGRGMNVNGGKCEDELEKLIKAFERK